MVSYYSFKQALLLTHTLSAWSLTPVAIKSTAAGPEGAEPRSWGWGLYDCHCTPCYTGLVHAAPCMRDVFPG